MEKIQSSSSSRHTHTRVYRRYPISLTKYIFICRAFRLLLLYIVYRYTYIKEYTTFAQVYAKCTKKIDIVSIYENIQAATFIYSADRSNTTSSSAAHNADNARYQLCFILFFFFSVWISDEYYIFIYTSLLTAAIHIEYFRCGVSECFYCFFFFKKNVLLVCCLIC